MFETVLQSFLVFVEVYTKSFFKLLMSLLKNNLEDDESFMKLSADLLILLHSYLPRLQDKFKKRYNMDVEDFQVLQKHVSGIIEVCAYEYCEQRMNHLYHEKIILSSIDYSKDYGISDASEPSSWMQTVVAEIEQVSLLVAEHFKIDFKKKLVDKAVKRFRIVLSNPKMKHSRKVKSSVRQEYNKLFLISISI